MPVGGGDTGKHFVELLEELGLTDDHFLEVGAFDGIEIEIPVQIRRQSFNLGEGLLGIVLRLRSSRSWTAGVRAAFGELGFDVEDDGGFGGGSVGGIAQKLEHFGDVFAVLSADLLWSSGVVIVQVVAAFGRAHVRPARGGRCIAS